MRRGVMTYEEGVASWGLILQLEDDNSCLEEAY